MLGDAACGIRCYFQVNHQGSTIALSRQDASLEAAYGYDAYGRSSAAAAGNPFRYTGRRLDPETGLYYYRARYYSTNTEGVTSPDVVYEGSSDRGYLRS
jgi:RHS repeat-associated protein